MRQDKTVYDAFFCLYRDITPLGKKILSLTFSTSVCLRPQTVIKIDTLPAIKTKANEVARSSKSDRALHWK